MKSPGPEFKKFSQTLKKIILDSWFPERGNNPDYTPAEKRKKIRNLQARVRRLISNTPDEEHCTPANVLWHMFDSDPRS